MTAQYSRTAKWSWREVSAALATLVALLGMARLAGPLTRVAWGRGVAKYIELLESRVVTYNPGATGYYERLFGATKDTLFLSPAEFRAWTRGFDDRTYDRSFLTFRLKPNLNDLRSKNEPQGLTTNSLSILGPEISMAKPPATRRIAVFGDSVTQGWGTDQNAIYTARLSHALNADFARTGERFEVLNYSAPGYQLDQMMDRAVSEAPQVHPDVYLVALSELAVFRNWGVHLVYVIRFGEDRKYDFVRDIIRRSGALPSDDGLTVLSKLAPFRAEFIRDCLNEIRRRAEKDGARMVVALIPSVEDGDMCKHRMSDAKPLIASLSRSGMGIPVIDVLDAFDGVTHRESLRVNPVDVHPNAAGHEMIFEALYSRMRARPELWKAITGADETVANQNGTH